MFFRTVLMVYLMMVVRPQWLSMVDFMDTDSEVELIEVLVVLFS